MSVVTPDPVPTIPARYRKAIYGFLAAFITLGGAVASLGFLSGPLSHDLAIALAAATLLVVPFGVAKAPANAVVPVAGSTVPVSPLIHPVPTVNEIRAAAPPTRAESLAQEVRQFLADAEIIRQAITGPVATTSYGPSPVDPSTVLAGVVTPPPAG